MIRRPVRCARFASIAAASLIGGDAVAQQPCRFSASSTASVTAVRDGRTLVLADGREVRLAAIEVADGTRAALQSLVEGRQIRLEQTGTSPDRYGRVVAFVYAEDTHRSIQETLLAEGLARVSTRIGSKGCADELLNAELTARAAQRGFWTDPNFAPLPSDDVTRIAAAQGQFALIEGKVLSVRESGSTIYLNFGRRWTREFAVTVLKRHRREFAEAGIDPKDLEGRKIRVRGWVEQRGGPLIEATAPEQIEIAK